MWVAPTAPAPVSSTIRSSSAATIAQTSGEPENPPRNTSELPGWTTTSTQILDTVLAIAKEQGVPPGQVAIAWLLHRAATSSTALIPILGANTRTQLDANLAATALTLSDDQAERLDVVSAIPLGFPHSVLAPDRSGLRIAGGRPELLASRFAPAA